MAIDLFPASIKPKTKRPYAAFPWGSSAGDTALRGAYSDLQDQQNVGPSTQVTPMEWSKTPDPLFEDNKTSRAIGIQGIQDENTLWPGMKPTVEDRASYPNSPEYAAKRDPYHYQPVLGAGGSGFGVPVTQSTIDAEAAGRRDGLVAQEKNQSGDVKGRQQAAFELYGMKSPAQLEQEAAAILPSMRRTLAWHQRNQELPPKDVQPLNPGVVGHDSIGNVMAIPSIQPTPLSHNDMVANTMQAAEALRKREGLAPRFGHQLGTLPSFNQRFANGEIQNTIRNDPADTYMAMAQASRDSANRGDVTGTAANWPGAWDARDPKDWGKPAKSTTQLANETAASPYAWGLKRLYAAHGQPMPETVGQAISDRAAWHKSDMADRMAMVQSRAANRADARSARMGNLPWSEVQSPITAAEAQYQVNPTRENMLVAHPESIPYMTSGKETRADNISRRRAAVEVITNPNSPKAAQEWALQTIREIDGNGTQATPATTPWRASSPTSLPPSANPVVTPDSIDTAPTPSDFDPSVVYKSKMPIDSYLDEVASKYGTNLSSDQQVKLSAFLEKAFSPVERQELDTKRNRVGGTKTKKDYPQRYRRHNKMLGLPEPSPSPTLGDYKADSINYITPAF